MMKAYHLYLYVPEYAPYLPPMEMTVADVEQAINMNAGCIYTYQVVTCTTDLFNKGYRIFVHNTPDDQYEIKLGCNERTNREIKMGHCLYKMILAGEFEKE